MKIISINRLFGFGFEIVLAEVQRTECIKLCQIFCNYVVLVWRTSHFLQEIDLQILCLNESECFEHDYIQKHVFDWVLNVLN